MKKSIFFAEEGQKGLNSTSAQHVCALATQLKAQAEAALENISFITTKVDLAGVPSAEKIISLGVNEKQFDEISSNVKIVSDMNKIISWYSEARKSLKEAREIFETTGIGRWCKDNGIEIPEFPSRPLRPRTVTIDEIIEEMNVKDRSEYLALEAKSAVLGKFIHKSHPMEVARQAMHEALSVPYVTEGVGRDMTIRHFEPSVDPVKVDEKFVALQAEYRATEQALNHMKADLRDKVDARQIELENQYRLDLAEFDAKNAAWKSQNDEINSKFNEWRVAENKALSKVKFIIPDALKSTIDYLNNLAKK